MALWSVRARRLRPKIGHSQVLRTRPPGFTYTGKKNLRGSVRWHPVCPDNELLRFNPLMSIAKSILAILLCYAMVLPGFGQQMPTTRMLTGDVPTTMIDRFTYNYRAHGVRKISFEDSPRLEKLIRAGIIYLSLRDAIALALENNLDLEYARINPK